MKPILVPVFIFALILACGCTGSPPVPPAGTPQTAITPIPATTPVPATTPAITVPVTTAVTEEITGSVSDNTIRIVKNSFDPADMTVKAGSTVRWVNLDDHPHRIAFEDKAFTTSTFLLGASQSASQRFFQPGAYNYSCLIHPFMQGTITVVP